LPPNVFQAGQIRGDLAEFRVSNAGISISFHAIEMSFCCNASPRCPRHFTNPEGFWTDDE